MLDEALSALDWWEAAGVDTLVGWGLPFVEIATIIVVGVLLDTLVVRALLVPALALDLGRFTWWPSALAARRAAPQVTALDPVRPR